MGGSFIWYLGTIGKSKGIMLSSDLNIHDEVDRSDLKTLDTYKSRLAASDFKGEWIFSNPSQPNIGVDRYWKLSDQKHWFIKCSHCGYERYLTYWKKEGVKRPPHYVDEDREIFACGKCHKELSDEDRRVGRWVAKYPGREISGYWITQLMCAWISAKEIINTKKTTTTEYFYNFVMGMPYASKDVSIDRGVISRNMTGEKNPMTKPCAMGVDNGVLKHYVIGNEDGIFAYGATEKWSDIERLLKRYDIMLALSMRTPILRTQRSSNRLIGERSSLATSKGIGIIWESYNGARTRTSAWSIRIETRPWIGWSMIS